MTVVSTDKDLAALTLTFVAQFDADVEQVWQLWADPRQLERWWGPPGWPATFTRYEFTPGGEARYHMTGPDKEVAGGYWRFTALEPPTSLALEDGFTDEQGEPVDEPPVRLQMELVSEGEGTRMTMVSTFASAEQFEQLVAMGMEEGMRLALGQIDDVLAQVA